MGKLIDGRTIAEGILRNLRPRVARFLDAGKPLKLAVVFVGSNEASLSYVKSKQAVGQKLGIAVDIVHLSETASEASVLDVIKSLNEDLTTTGVLVQLPQPKQFDRQKVLDAVRPDKDVDCLNSVNQEKLETDSAAVLPPAPGAILEILKYHDIDLSGSRVLIVGRGILIGRPLAAILRIRGVKFAVADSKTTELLAVAREADVVISGAGRRGLITGEMIKAGAVVIDAGTTGADDGSVVGDVDTKSVLPKASLLAGVPGGVGPVTVAMLFQNVVAAAFDKKQVSK